MNNTRINELKREIDALKRELQTLESETKFKIHWLDIPYGLKHTTTVTAKNKTAAKRLFKSKKLSIIKHTGNQTAGSWTEVVPYEIIKVV